MKNFGSDGIIFNPDSINVTAFATNGGSIDLETPTGTLSAVVGGTLNADAYNGATGASGGTIILNASLINTSVGTLLLSAQSQGTTGTGGTVDLTQSGAGNLLTVGSDSNLNIYVGGTGTGGSIVLNAPAGITVSGSLSTSSSSSLSGSVNISVAGTGSITATSSSGSITTGALSVTLGTGTAVLSNINISSLTLTSQSGTSPTAGSASISNLSTSIALNTIAAGGNFQLSTNGSITVNTGVSSQTGAVTLQNTNTATGDIVVNGNVSAGGGPLTIENDNLSGIINIAPSVSLFGQGTPSAGTIQGLTGVALLSGPFPPSPVPGSIPNNVNVFINGIQVQQLAQNAPTVFFGLGLTSAWLITVNASNGCDIVFSGNSAGSIILGSGVTITTTSTAPPPVPPPTEISTISTEGNQGIHQITLPETNYSYVNSVVKLPTDLTPFGRKESPAVNPLPNETVPTSPEGIGGAIYVSKAFDQNIVSQLNSEEQAAVEADNNDIIPAAFSPDTVSQLNSNGLAAVEAENDILKLRSGNIVLAPGHDIVVNSEFGNVYIARGAAAFLMRTANSLCVYALSDTRTGDITVIANKHKITAVPGQQILLTITQHPVFSDVNPGKPIGYRSVRSYDLGGGTTVFTSDFSLVSALVQVKPLHQLVREQSADPRTRRLGQLLLRNAAILAILYGGQQPYKQGQ